MKDMINSKDNITIANFMGFTLEENIGWYDNEMLMLQDVYDTQGGNCFDELLFDKSWDWLIPVINKIVGNFEFNKQEELQENEYRENIMDIVPFGNMQDTYNAVVEFITWYNKNK